MPGPFGGYEQISQGASYGGPASGGIGGGGATAAGTSWEGGASGTGSGGGPLPGTTPVDRRMAAFLGGTAPMGIPGAYGFAGFAPQAGGGVTGLDRIVTLIATAVQRRLEDMFASTRGRFGFSWIILPVALALGALLR